MKYIKSPLNYTGGKYRFLDYIIPQIPKGIDTFVDLFCGGLNVGINVSAKHIIANDRLKQVIDFYRYLYTSDFKDVLESIFEIIKLYGLSDENDDAYYALRSDYNKDMSNPILLYMLVCHSFSNFIRFNDVGEFNNPFGQRTFNKSMKLNLSQFVNKMKSIDMIFVNNDFRYFDYSVLTENDFVYVDPPYLISDAPYNVYGGGWCKQDDADLFDILDSLTKVNVRWMMSNVLSHGGIENNELILFSEKYHVLHIDADYSHCVGTVKKDGFSDEVIITNYELKKCSSYSKSKLFTFKS